MPRKVSQPPPILAIQSLSTGKRLDLVSDFPDKQEIPHEYAGPLPSSEDILRARNRLETNEQLLILQLLGVPTPGMPDLRPKPKPPKPKAPEIKGQRAIAKLGDKLVIMFKSDPIRRW